MPMFYVSGVIGLVVVILFIIFYVIACMSVERTKNEAIRIRELLENINRIEVARYKKEFNVSEAPGQNINTEE